MVALKFWQEQMAIAKPVEHKNSQLEKKTCIRMEAITIPPFTRIKNYIMKSRIEILREKIATGQQGGGEVRR
jgi:hypothetical protein